MPAPFVGKSLEIRTWWIYKITNPNGKVYIGKTCDIKSRKRHYRSLSNTKQQHLIHNSIIKHGFDNHKFEIIEEFDGTASDVASKEMFWIRSHMSNHRKWPNIGLNLTNGGDGDIGRIWTEDERRKMSEIKKGNPYKHTDEAKKRIGEAAKGNKYCAGRKHTEEWKKASSERHKGRPAGNHFKNPSREMIEKRRASMTGRKITQEHAQKKVNTFVKNHGVAVLQYDLSGNFIAEYSNINLAERMTGCDNRNIHLQLRGKRKRVKGFVFKYKKEPTCQ